jgi:hypothetical protein
VPPYVVLFSSVFVEASIQFVDRPGSQIAKLILESIENDLLDCIAVGNLY